MQRKMLWLAMVIAGVAGGSISAAEPPGGQKQPPKLRVGTYDSRALAVVYCRTPEFNAKIRKLMDEQKKAKTAGDAEKVKHIEAEGRAQQARLHEQGFSGAPVDDILATIKTKLPGIAKEAGVDVIVSKWQIAYQAPEAELLDVTGLVIKAFNPDEKAMRIVKDLMSKPLIPVEEVRKHKH
jgi:hypothetical protein